MWNYARKNENFLKTVMTGHVWSWPSWRYWRTVMSGHDRSWPSWRYWQTVMTGHDRWVFSKWSWLVMTTHNRYWKTRFFSIPFFCLWPVMTAHGMQKNITYSIFGFRLKEKAFWSLRQASPTFICHFELCIVTSESKYVFTIFPF